MSWGSSLPCRLCGNFPGPARLNRQLNSCELEQRRKRRPSHRSRCIDAIGVPSSPSCFENRFVNTNKSCLLAPAIRLVFSAGTRTRSLWSLVAAAEAHFLSRNLFFALARPPGKIIKRAIVTNAPRSGTPARSCTNFAKVTVAVPIRVGCTRAFFLAHAELIEST